MDSKEEEESAGEIETDDFFMDDDIDKVITTSRGFERFRFRGVIFMVL